MSLRNILIVVIFLLPQPLHAMKVDVLSYYTSEPFYHTGKKGLINELIDELNHHNAGLELDYKLVSRPLLNKLISNIQRPFIVPLVHPLWFNDPKQEKYIWSDPLYHDSNAVISPFDQPFEFDGLESLRDKTVGVPSGFKIRYLDELVDQQKAYRIDTPTMPALVQKVAQGQLKIAILPYVSAYHEIKKYQLSDKIHFSVKPHQTYLRYFMIVNGTPKIQNALNKAIKEIQENGRLKEILKEYGYK